MNIHTLVFQVRGLEPLEAAMGPVVTRSTLEQLDVGIRHVVGTVLHRAVQQPMHAPSRGCWVAEFNWNEDHLLAEPLEQRLAAASAAATQLGSNLAREVFGSATASLARLCVVLLPGRVMADGLDARLDTVFSQASAYDAEERQLEQMMREGSLRTFLQPIVDFSSGHLVGYEALTRGPEGSPLERADELFGAATHCGLSYALEIACARQAVQWAEHLPSGQWLTINLSPETLLDAEMRRMLARPGIVVELTEHLPLVSAQALLPAIAELRAGGALLALDDTGCGYADIQAAEALRPDFVKLCITVIRSASLDTRVLDALGETIRSLRALGIDILAEGVENAQEAETLRTFDIDYAQGWLYGKPGPAQTWLSPA